MFSNYKSRANERICVLTGCLSFNINFRTVRMFVTRFIICVPAYFNHFYNIFTKTLLN